MNRDDLVGELQRLGRTPAPPPDEERVAVWEHQLLHELPAPEVLVRTPIGRSRRHRRQLVVGGFAVAAAAAVVALVVGHTDGAGTELQEVSGAVIVLPDGSTRPLRDGDQLPPGGIVETGPNGRLTIDGLTVGPNQVALVDDGHVTPLPQTTTQPGPATTAATSLPTPTAPTSRPASGLPTAPVAAPTPTPRRGTSPAPVTAAPPRTAVTPAATLPAVAAPTTRAPAPPAATPTNRLLSLAVSPAGDGVRLTWSAPGSTSFGRYVVIRSSLSLSLPKVIGVLPDQGTVALSDPDPPRGVRLYYRVVAVAADNHLLAVSRAVSIELPAAPASTSGPPSTMTAASSVPSHGGHHGPTTSAPTTTAAGTTATDTTGPAEPRCEPRRSDRRCDALSRPPDDDADHRGPSRSG